MEHWLKDIACCVQKHNPAHSCHNFPAGSRQAATGARICETILSGVLGTIVSGPYISSWVIASWVVVTAELEIIASWDDRTSNC